MRNLISSGVGLVSLACAFGLGCSSESNGVTEGAAGSDESFEGTRGGDEGGSAGNPGSGGSADTGKGGRAGGRDAGASGSGNTATDGGAGSHVSPGNDAAKGNDAASDTEVSSVQCSDLAIPASATLSAMYSRSSGSETTWSVRNWNDASGRNVLVLTLEWSLVQTLQFPMMATVSGGQTAGAVVMFYWKGCAQDLSSCQKEYLIYDGIMTIDQADRSPLGSISASSRKVVLQEQGPNDYIFPGSCWNVAALDWDATYLCQPNGNSCASASDCCANVCNGGVCGTPTCKDDGESCENTSQCCASSCNGGICGGSTCKANGSYCTSTSECCTSSCNGGVCGGSTSCNPVTNTGCSYPEECILLSTESSSCAMAGSGTQADSCSSSSPCAGGHACFGGTCRKICKKSTGQGCDSGSACNGVTGWTIYGACT
jgi:hypothetical protein